MGRVVGDVICFRGRREATRRWGWAREPGWFVDVSRLLWMLRRVIVMGRRAVG